MKKTILFFCIIILFSCEKNQQAIPSFDTTKDDKLIIALKKAYNLSSFNEAPTADQKNIIIQLLESSEKYKHVFSKLNINTFTLFQNPKENITIVIFSFKTATDKYFSIKGYFNNNEFIITNHFYFARKLQDKNNGQIIITNNNDALLINVINGVESFSTIEGASQQFQALQMNDCAGNHGGTGFCQRQVGERFSDCYKLEKDEFCDGFWSCIAVDTQPQVMLLIAAACTCSATLCS